MAINNLYPISKMLRGYVELYPNVNTSFRQTMGSTEEMRQQLLNGEIDFCVSSPPIEGDNIECIHLFSEEIYLIVPHGHKFSSRKNVDLIEAIDEPFISLKFGFGIRDLTEQLCMLAGFKPKILFESEVALNLIDMVNYNMGIALLPILEWEDLPDRVPVPLHINHPKCSRATALSYLNGHYLTHASRNFINYQIKYFEAIREKSSRKY
ncbi:HTH-type transcriptional regulator GltC [bioreactor metagenome]|uniref:HTH-type transcriptional regulator GltC n=1 Tax=bioreactor metagenome TaxID=1076179 RepID=A0A645EWD0_9ZZZZ